MLSSHAWKWLGLLSIVGAAAVAGCGSDAVDGSGGFGATTTDTGSHANGSGTASGGGSPSASTFVGTGTGPGVGGGSQGAGGANGNFDVTPHALQTITVVTGQTLPKVTFTATYNGTPAKAGWSVDRGEIGTIPAASSSKGVFTPSGAVGGLVNVTAGFTVGGTELDEKRQVLVKLQESQNGPTSGEMGQVANDPTTLLQGGGIGGVGGEGIGGAVSSPGDLAALDAPADDGSALQLRMLYPYNSTVFPRGILAPLLMWDWATGDADAIKIHLHTKSGSFDWTGTFAAPAILAQTGGKFIRHPIPQDIWAQATNSAGGKLATGGDDTLSMDLVVEKAGVAHGPISQTWTVAPGLLNGVIYYNSYGTHLAENLGGAVGGDGRFGGAVLGIHVGDSGPTLVAGNTSPDETGCRVCHAVASNGSRLIVQHGEAYGTSSIYDLTPTGATETTLPVGTTFPALYPDGSNALGSDGNIYPLPMDQTPVTPTGLAAVSTFLGSPAFAPDGKQIVFNPMTDGAGNPLAPPQQLVVMKFDPVAVAFSVPTVVVDDSGGAAEARPGWAAFLPDGASLVFHHQSAAGADGNGGAYMNTRKGAKAQIAWASASTTGSITTLNALNGLDPTGASYLPTLAAPTTLLVPGGATCTVGGAAVCCSGDGTQVDTMNPLHDDDANVNFEPTVNPIASGGYAWVVFTSRRMYGSVATIGPYCSDPRGVDLTDNVTPKKLWVAAIDLDAHAGADSSHPAFYLPAQELLAGNSRAFWVLDPCKSDGSSCTAGDECCNGFCEPNGPGGALVCSNMSHSGMCSMTNEKCKTTADCCNQVGDSCIGGFCVQNGPH